MARANRGYTIAEILIAIVVVAVLAGSLTPLVFKQVDRSRFVRARQDSETIATAIARFVDDTGSWPCGLPVPGGDTRDAVLDDLACLYEPHGAPGWNGPYLKRSAGNVRGCERAAKLDSIENRWIGLVDPWRQPYRLALVGDDGIAVYSTGRNTARDSEIPGLVAGEPNGDDIVHRLVASR